MRPTHRYSQQGAATPPLTEDKPVTKTINTTETLTIAEIETLILAALTDDELTEFAPVRRGLERRPDIAFGDAATALLSLWGRGDVEIVEIGRSTYAKLSDDIDRLPVHPLAAARGEHRRILAI